MAEFLGLSFALIAGLFVALTNPGAGPSDIEAGNRMNATLSAANLQLPPVDHNCKWTGCEGKTQFGVNICNWYGAGRYTGNVNHEGCDWDTSRVECCHPLPSGTVKWSKNCYGIAYGGGYVCSSEYGPEFVHAGGVRACNSISYAYECRN